MTTIMTTITFGELRCCMAKCYYFYYHYFYYYYYYCYYYFYYSTRIRALYGP